MTDKAQLQLHLSAIQRELDKIEAKRGRITAQDLREWDMLSTEMLKATDLLTESLPKWKQEKERDTILNILLDCRLTLI